MLAMLFHYSGGHEQGDSWGGVCPRRADAARPTVRPSKRSARRDAEAETSGDGVSERSAPAAARGICDLLIFRLLLHFVFRCVYCSLARRSEEISCCLVFLFVVFFSNMRPCLTLK